VGKQDEPLYAPAASALNEVALNAAKNAALDEQCQRGITVACEDLSREETAKRAWLARQAAPAWGAAAKAVSALTETATMKPSEEAAKQAYLAKLDAPTWGQAAKVVSSVVADASQMQVMEEQCNQGVHKACDELSKEDEAKRAWLAKLDVPAWGKISASVSEEAAKAAWLARQDAPAWSARGKEDKPLYAPADAALNDAVSDASRKAALEEQCNEGVQVACEDLSREEAAKAAWLAKQDASKWTPAAGKETAAKRAWLAKQDAPAAWAASAKRDVPLYAPAAAALNEVASDATTNAVLEEQCDHGVQAACEDLSSEEDARRAWLAKQDVTAWGAAATAVSTLTAAAAMDPSDDAAKQAYLAKLDATTWGQAAEAVSSVVADAAQMQWMEKQCKQGIDIACNTLTKENTAKRAWLTKFDVPAWRVISAAVSEEAAKAAWLAKQDR